MRSYTRGAVLALVAALAALATEAEALEPNAIDHIDYENGALEGMAIHAGYDTSSNPRHVTIYLNSAIAATVTEVLFSGVNVNDLLPAATRFIPVTDAVAPNALSVEVPPMVATWNPETPVTVKVDDETCLPETFNYFLPPRAMYLYTEQYVSGVGDSVRWRTSFVPIDKTYSEGILSIDDSSTIVLEESAGDKTFLYSTDATITITGSAGGANDSTFTVAGSSYDGTNTTVTVTGTPLTPEGAPTAATVVIKKVEVEITDGSTTWIVPDDSLDVTSTYVEVTLWSGGPSALGEYDVTLKLYPGSEDEMSTDECSNDGTYNSAGDPMTIYIVHDPAALSAVDESPYNYLVPLAGNIDVVLTGTEFYTDTGGMDDSGTRVYIDGVRVDPDDVTYDSPTQITIVLPPSADDTEGPIMVEVANFGQSSRSGRGSDIAYEDEMPSVRMLAPAPAAILSGDVHLQADARDDRSVTKVEYWYAVGAGPHYHPHDRSGVGYPEEAIFDNYVLGDWDPHADDLWDTDIGGGGGVWTLIGTVDGADGFPYDFDWTSMSIPGNGIFTITAVVYDDRTGGSQVQAPNPPDLPVTIEVVDPGSANNPPVVTIHSPMSGADIYAAGANILISASATDDDSTIDDIQFWYLDGLGDLQPLGAGTNTPIEGAEATLTWMGMIWDDILGADKPAPKGSLYIVAEAIPDSGPVGYTAVAVNIVDDTILTISNATPNTSDYAGANPTTHVQVEVGITGSGFVEDANETLIVYFAGEEATITSIMNTYLTVEVPPLPDDLEDGAAVPIRIEIVNTDDEDDVIDWVEHPGLFTVTDSAPRVEILSPQDGRNVGHGVVIVTSAFDDRGITEMLFEVTDGSDWFEIGTLTPEPGHSYVSYPYSMVWDMSVPEVDPDNLLGYDNLHEIRVRVTDDEIDGLETFEENIIPVSVRPRDGFGAPYVNPPVVEIVSPANGETVETDTSVPITLTVTHLISVSHAAVDFNATNKEIMLHSDVGDVRGDYPPGTTITIQGAANTENNGTFTVDGVPDWDTSNTTITVLETLVNEVATTATVNSDEQTIFLTGAPTLRVVNLGTGYEFPSPPTVPVIPVDTVINWPYTTDLLDGPFYLIEASVVDDEGNTGVGGANVTIGIPPIIFTGGGKSCGGWDGDMPLAFFVVMMAVAVPLLASRRARRPARGRVR